MNKSETQSWDNTISPAGLFSHIYVEEGAKDFPLTKRILEKRADATVIPIRHYKDLFNRSGQNFVAQKQSPALILAVNHGELIYRGARVCQSFGYDHFYYCSNLYNCIYDCEYCYLQGMYPSGNVVVFVNTDDYFARLEEMLADHPMYICISYDTDLLALESLLGLVARWTEFVRAHDNLTIEVRTKSCVDIPKLGLPVCERVIFAWTLSPDEVTNAYEHRTPSLEARLQAVRKAMDASYPIRLCFDPMIAVPDYEKCYRDLYRSTFEVLDANRIQDTSIGVFRISNSYLKSMRKKRCCAITAYPYDNIEGVATYGENKTREMMNFAKSELSRYLPKAKIYETEF